MTAPPRRGGTAPPPADALATPAEGERLQSRIVRGGAMRMASYGASAALSALAAALLLRALGVEDAGRYFPVIALVGIVGGVGEIGLTAVGVREYSTRTGADRAGFFRALLGLRLVLAIVSIVVGPLVAWVIGFDQTMILGSVMVGVAFLFTTLQIMLVTPLTSALRYGWSSVLDLVRGAGTLAVVACLFLVGAGLLPFYAAAIPGAALAALLTATLVRGWAPVRPSFSPGEWAPLLRAILPYAVAVSLSVIYFRVGAVIVSIVSTDAQAGFYGTAYRVIEVLSAALPTVLVTVLPVLARRSLEDSALLTSAMTRVTRVAAVLGGLAVVTLWLGAEVVIDVLAGGSFDGAIVPLQIQSLALGANLIVTAFGYGLLARQQHRALLFANLVGAACAFGLTIPLAATEGAIGASIGLAAAEIALAAAYFVAFSRRTEIQVMRSLAIVVAAVGIATFGGMLLPVGSVVAAVAGAAIYLTIIVGTGLVPLRRDTMRGLLRRT